MLAKLFDMHIFLYGIIGAGVLGVILMEMTGLLGKQKIQDTQTYEKFRRRMQRVSWGTSFLCLLFMAGALIASYRLKRLKILAPRYLILGVGIALLLLVIGKALSMLAREEAIGRFILEKMDRMEKTGPERTEDGIEVEGDSLGILSDRVVRNMEKNISQGESRYSHLISDEEEDVMRDVIREFIANYS